MTDASPKCDPTPRWLRELRSKRHAVGFWLYLHTYCRFLYRPHMRLIHRYGWHWWKHMHLEDGARHDWCQWCGAYRFPSPPLSAEER